MRLLSTLGIVLGILAVVGCGGSDEPTQTPAPSATAIVPPTSTLTPDATSTPVVAPTAPFPTPTPGASTPNCPATAPGFVPPGDVPPNIFLGTATIDGEVVPDGTNVTSCIDGEPVTSSLVSAGKFLLTIEQKIPELTGKTITFSVDGLDAKETAVWTLGAAVLLDISAER